MTQLMELDFAIAQRLDRQYLAGAADIDYEDCLEKAELHPQREVDVTGAVSLMTEAMRRHDQPPASDAWLGPRLHYALRLTRREAARRGVWRYLAVAACPEYVRWRWAKSETAPATAERFVGPDSKHAIARLWWMAELFRDGPDYGPAVTALENQDIVNNLFRMDVAHHRPTVLGAVRVLAGRSGDEANALAKAANAAAATQSFEMHAPDVEQDAAALRRWVRKAPDLLAFHGRLPTGPEDPPAAPSSIEAMESLFSDLLSEAPVRRR